MQDSLIEMKRKADPASARGKNARLQRLVTGTQEDDAEDVMLQTSNSLRLNGHIPNTRPRRPSDAAYIKVNTDAISSKNKNPKNKKKLSQKAAQTAAESGKQDDASVENA